MHRLRCLALAVVTAGFLGCGGDGLTRVDIEGSVTAKGVPVSHATVTFSPAAGTKGFFFSMSGTP